MTTNQDLTKKNVKFTALRLNETVQNVKTVSIHFISFRIIQVNTVNEKLIYIAEIIMLIIRPLLNLYHWWKFHINTTILMGVSRDKMKPLTSVGHDLLLSFQVLYFLLLYCIFYFWFNVTWIQFYERVGSLIWF